MARPLASIKEAITILVATTAILFPATIALSLYILKGELKLGCSAIAIITYHLKFSMSSYFLSLIFATFNINRLPTMVLKDYNLAYDKQTVILAVFQGLCFAFATFRLLRSFWAIF